MSNCCQILETEAVTYISKLKVLRLYISADDTCVYNKHFADKQADNHLTII